MNHINATAVHIVHNYTYANAAARTGAGGFVAGDIGKVAYQSDNSSWWVLAATTPTWAELTSTSLSLGTTKRESAGQSVTNSAVLVDCTNLSGFTLATGSYFIEACIFITVGASATPDIKIAFQVNTSTVNAARLWARSHESGSVATGDSANLLLTTTHVGSAPTGQGPFPLGTSGSGAILIHGTINVTNAGTLDFQFAQNTATVGIATTVDIGSYITLTPIA